MYVSFWLLEKIFVSTFALYSAFSMESWIDTLYTYISTDQGRKFSKENVFLWQTQQLSQYKRTDIENNHILSLTTTDSFSYLLNQTYSWTYSMYMIILKKNI